jgi:hypothetical protein
MTRKTTPRGLPKAVSTYMAEIGAKGGKNGRGARKTRTAAHYQKMVEVRRRNKELRDD